MKALIAFTLLVVGAFAQTDCTEPKEVLIFSDTQFEDRNFKLSSNGNYCLYLGGDANLFVRKYNSSAGKCDGERIWKSKCRCNKDGGVDYLLRFQKDGNLLVRDGDTHGPPIWKSSTNLPQCNNHKPSNKPSSKPSNKPSNKPSSKPSNKPTTKPANKPTNKPNHKPSNKPSDNHIKKPHNHNNKPISKPTNKPTHKPTNKPAHKPTHKPTNKSTKKPNHKSASKPNHKPTKKSNHKSASKSNHKPTSKPDHNNRNKNRKLTD
eukprot:CAMPEP_0195306352 /NCGR_PEP_ID=MMETSP0707-20130614/37157_1 /TAXON_ID=33640 /ORGANISM="Asterionellopsis glacialis, Strain CCMP134" /LENGTH=262 /DNA_ID=CAMNT_0040370567 /DNA_START=72 /DNA_END=860 /DNA_ORIENTATION=-